MEYGRPLIVMPQADEAPNAQWSVVSGTENVEYPASYLGNRNPARPFKATGTSVTARATFGSDVILVGVSIQNHNLAGATVSITSGSGLSQPIPTPANDYDDLWIGPWLDFSSALLVQRTSTQFNIVVTGGLLGPIAIGEVILITAFTDLNLKLGAKYQPTRLQIRHRTWGASHLQYDKRIRIRTAKGMLDLRSDEATMRRLEAEAIGGYHPFLFIPDEDVNEAWYVQLVPGSFSYSLQTHGVTQMPFEVQEISSGPRLYA
jgi:hypothetical protein